MCMQGTCTGRRGNNGEYREKEASGRSLHIKTTGSNDSAGSISQGYWTVTTSKRYSRGWHMESTKNILEFKNITKKYAGVVALDNVSLAFRAGEVHALAGENGAGKSTLIKSTTGAVIPTSGTILIDGKEYTNNLTPAIAKEQGVAVIYQEFNLVNDISIAENVFLGSPIRTHGMIDMKAMVSESQKIFEQLGINIDVTANVRTLTTGYQQLVEIAKALSHKVKILVMDEPSASLTTNEVEIMFKIIKKLKASGVTIIYISHRLDEIFEITDRVSILRDGKMIKTVNTCDTNRQELISMMVGRELTEQYPKLDKQEQTEVVMDVQHLKGPGVKDVSFQLRKGEILGFGGLVGAGRTESVQLVCGITGKTGGTITYKGKELKVKNPKDAIEQGIALAPEDRKKQGLMLHMSVGENIYFPSLLQISKHDVIDYTKAKNIVGEYIKALAIKTPSDRQICKNLSGGNQQKVVIAKWLAKNPDVIILDEPTRGIDVGAKQEIYGIMNELIQAGKSIIMISSDMEELLGMSDRIVVFCEGRVTGELSKEEFCQEAVMSLASQS